ncbi:MAG TPA: ABC transporter permease, partial [Homoserinimonas sp.]|nr:ABC transporter permease [Homoserinimonas sp.]
MSDTLKTETAPASPPTTPAEPSRWNTALREIVGGSTMISLLSIVIALAVGAILIAITDERVQETSGYFFSRPSDL